LLDSRFSFFKMNILFLNTYDNNGGAAIACLRIMEGLNNANVQSKMLVKSKKTDNKNIIAVEHTFIDHFWGFLRFAYERLIFSGYEKTKDVRFMFSLANTGYNLASHPLVKEADIIHLHWTNFGFLSLENIKQLAALNKPVLWTFHDMWPMTGGCHHSYKCDNYFENCGNCLYLRKSGAKDLSYKILKKKKAAFASFNSNIDIVTVSSWLKERTISSSLFKKVPVHIIHNPLNTSAFNKKDKRVSRDLFKLPQDKKIILFTSVRLDHPIKGWDYLKRALNLLEEKDARFSQDVVFVLLGKIKNEAGMLTSFSGKTIHIGDSISMEKLPYVYSAADVTAVPSLYETFSQVTSESMACGTPVVAFNNSGPRDIIDHLKNGYLAQFESVDDFANGLEFILNQPFNVFSDAARQKIVDNYSEEIIVQKYISIYNSILANQSR
jgi:glycosyltransferase involved in cell wall biosynthesis